MNKSTQSLKVRFESIWQDAEWISECGRQFNLPIVANERCGSWYVQPAIRAESSYFKSTDGHKEKWAFSQRRLNLHLLPLIEQSGGCIIVDSTRSKSKRFPDALSKTIPIWCYVLNHLLYPTFDAPVESHLPSEDVLPREEVDRIKQEVPGMIANARQIDLDVTGLRARITRPLRPIFIDPTVDVHSLDLQRPSDSHLVVCTMASKFSVLPSTAYFHGAGDDEDNWAYGLTPSLFWANRSSLASASDDESTLKSFIATLDLSAGNSARSLHPIMIEKTGLAVGANPSLSKAGVLPILDAFDMIILCSDASEISGKDSCLTPYSPSLDDTGPRFAQLKLKPGKLGSRALRFTLPTIIPLLYRLGQEKPKILVTCHSGRDLSVGVALAILCLFYDASQNFHLPTRCTKEPISKSFIRQRLAWITMSVPYAAPSRTTLQSVHAFLMPQNELEGQWKVERVG